MQLRPGNYTLLAWTRLPFGGDYTLEYNFRPGAPPTFPALSLAPGANLTGSLSTLSSSRTHEGLADIYQIVTDAPGTLAIDMTSGDFSTFLALRDARDNRLAGAGSRIVADLPAGTYSLVASTLDTTGGYNIGYQFTAHELAPCGAATKLDAVAGYVGKLGVSPCRGADGQPVDYYELTAPADGSHAFTLFGQGFDPYLTIEDTAGNVLRRGGGLLADYFPGGRTLRIGVRAGDGATTGFYELRRYFAGGGPPPGCAGAGSIAPGQSIDGELNFTSCDYPGGTFADIYRLELAEAAELEVAVDSSQFDAIASVLDAKGNLIDTDALLELALDPGTYFVVAKSSSGDTGTYRLSVAPKQ